MDETKEWLKGLIGVLERVQSDLEKSEENGDSSIPYSVYMLTGYAQSARMMLGGQEDGNIKNLEIK